MRGLRAEQQCSMPTANTFIKQHMDCTLIVLSYRQKKQRSQSFCFAEVVGTLCSTWALSLLHASSLYTVDTQAAKTLKWWAGYLPEAGFRRHAPRQMKRRWLWRCRGTAMWTVVSSVGTSISLTGQSGTSALLSPVALWQPPAQRVKGRNKHVKPCADSPLFSLPHRSCLDNWFVCSLFFPPNFCGTVAATATGSYTSG